MPQAKNSIPTRQKEDLLLETKLPLGTGGSITLGPVGVSGYSEIAILGTSNLSFTVRLEEGCSREGPFVVTHTLLSSLVGALQQICRREKLCGIFLRATVLNTGGAPQASLNVCIQGIPVP